MDEELNEAEVNFIIPENIDEAPPNPRVKINLIDPGVNPNPPVMM